MRLSGITAEKNANIRTKKKSGRYTYRGKNAADAALHTRDDRALACVCTAYLNVSKVLCRSGAEIISPSLSSLLPRVHVTVLHTSYACMCAFVCVCVCVRRRVTQTLLSPRSS